MSSQSCSARTVLHHGSCNAVWGATTGARCNCRGALGGLGSLGDVRLHAASQQLYGDYGALAGANSPQLTEAALADSLYRSVALQLQSGAGPAVLPQARSPSFRGCCS